MGQIYDAALDSGLWSGVLDAIAGFVDAARATLIVEDAADPMRSILYSSLCKPEQAAAYLESFILVSPGHLARQGARASPEMLVEYDEPAPHDRPRTPFLHDFLRKRNLVDTAVAGVGRTAGTITVLSLRRSVERGFADGELRRKLALLVPHIERAAAIGLTLERRTANADSLADSLDKVAAGVFLLSDTGAVVHANAAARKLLAAGCVVRQVDGQLSPVDRCARAALSGALEGARGAGAGIDPDGVTVAFGGEGPGLVGTLFPLHAAACASRVVHHRAVALLCVRAATLETTQAAACLALRYRLTPRESSVLTGIVDQGGIPETAAALRLTEGTVKGYVKTIFQKTGARRQADLVRMVAGFASPFH